VVGVLTPLTTTTAAAAHRHPPRLSAQLGAQPAVHAGGCGPRAKRRTHILPQQKVCSVCVLQLYVCVCARHLLLLTMCRCCPPALLLRVLAAHSQPPLLSAMVRSVYEASATSSSSSTGADLALLRQALPLLLLEQAHWSQAPKAVTIRAADGTTHSLSRCVVRGGGRAGVGWAGGRTAAGARGPKRGSNCMRVPCQVGGAGLLFKAPPLRHSGVVHRWWLKSSSAPAARCLHTHARTTTPHTQCQVLGGLAPAAPRVVPRGC
jgi:hypothetical protein